MSTCSLNSLHLSMKWNLLEQLLSCLAASHINHDMSSHCFVLTAPTEAPVNVTVEALNASRISVDWVKPKKSVLHGNLVRYEVEYRRIQCSESDPVSVGDSSWKSVNVTNTSLRTEIGSLVFWSCYEVRVRAVTVGSGPYSEIIQVRTTEHGELLFL